MFPGPVLYLTFVSLGFLQTGSAVVEEGNTHPCVLADAELGPGNEPTGGRLTGVQVWTFINGS